MLTDFIRYIKSAVPLVCGLPVLFWLGSLLRETQGDMRFLCGISVIGLSLFAVVLLANRTRSAMAAFLFTGFAVSFLIFDDNLLDYTNLLFQRLTNPTMGIILVFGAVVELLRRSDLQRTKDTRRYFSIIDGILARVSNAKNGIVRFFLVGLITILTFVASTVTVAAFVGADKGGKKALAAICICTSGALLTWFSAWWLFFGELLPNFCFWALYPGPALFALLSLAHGSSLLGGSTSTSAWGSPYYFRIYWVTVVVVSVAFVSFMLLIQNPFSGNAISSDDSQSWWVQTQISAHQMAIAATPSDNGSDEGMGQGFKFWILTTGLGLTVILMLIQKWHVHGQHNESIKQQMSRVIGSMQTGLSIILLIGLVVTFTKMLQIEVDSIDHALRASAMAANGSSFPVPEWMRVCFAAIPDWGYVILSLALTTALGFMLGSAFGTFSIGYVVLSSLLPVLGVTVAPWLMVAGLSSLIVIAAFCNQWSFAADNWYTAMEDSFEKEAKVKGPKRFFAPFAPALVVEPSDDSYSPIRIFALQSSFVLFSIIFAFLWSWLLFRLGTA